MLAFGIEEEILLMDPATGRPRLGATDPCPAVPAEGPGRGRYSAWFLAAGIGSTFDPGNTPAVVTDTEATRARSLMNADQAERRLRSRMTRSASRLSCCSRNV